MPAACSDVAAALRSGIRISDREFDRFLPEPLRVASGRYWTPLVVIQRIAEWLADERIETLLDIGSGAGKFAVATACALPAIRASGIEHRAGLVDTANELARLFRVDDRVTFTCADLAEIPRADCYYLYNPFAENEYERHEWLDDTVPHDVAFYERDALRMEQFLAEVPVDTCLVVYNGFGGRIPPGYAQIYVDRYMPNILRMFRKMK